uniref:Uncharacterized protein n=1 Tax=Tetranychus urticae TaxID=32264 RepID=T1KXK6_TETUR
MYFTYFWTYPIVSDFTVAREVTFSDGVIANYNVYYCDPGEYRGYTYLLCSHHLKFRDDWKAGFLREFQQLNSGPHIGSFIFHVKLTLPGEIPCDKFGASTDRGLASDKACFRLFRAICRNLVSLLGIRTFEDIVLAFLQFFATVYRRKI